MVGGNSDAALRRVAAWADGWYGFYLDDVDAVAERVHFLREACRDVGREPADLRLAVALREPQVGDVAALKEIGIDEMVVVAGPPDIDAGYDWVDGLARRWRSG